MIGLLNFESGLHSLQLNRREGKRHQGSRTKQALCHMKAQPTEDMKMLWFLMDLKYRYMFYLDLIIVEIGKFKAYDIRAVQQVQIPFTLYYVLLAPIFLMQHGHKLGWCTHIGAGHTNYNRDYRSVIVSIPNNGGTTMAKLPHVTMAMFDLLVGRCLDPRDRWARIRSPQRRENRSFLHQVSGSRQLRWLGRMRVWTGQHLAYLWRIGTRNVHFRSANAGHVASQDGQVRIWQVSKLAMQLTSASEKLGGNKRKCGGSCS